MLPKHDTLPAYSTHFFLTVGIEKSQEQQEPSVAVSQGLVFPTWLRDPSCAEQKAVPNPKLTISYKTKP